MNRREREILEKTAEILRQRLHPRRIILFGSRAKGRSHPSSDFDFALEGALADRPSRNLTTEDIDKIAGLYKVDVVYLEEVEDDFKEIILKTGKVVYAQGT